jgi:hypothetical protein
VRACLLRDGFCRSSRVVLAASEARPATIEKRDCSVRISDGSADMKCGPTEASWRGFDFFVSASGQQRREQPVLRQGGAHLKARLGLAETSVRCVVLRAERGSEAADTFASQVGIRAGLKKAVHDILSSHEAC